MVRTVMTTQDMSFGRRRASGNITSQHPIGIRIAKDPNEVARRVARTLISRFHEQASYLYEYRVGDYPQTMTGGQEMSGIGLLDEWAARYRGHGGGIVEGSFKEDPPNLKHSGTHISDKDWDKAKQILNDVKDEAVADGFSSPSGDVLTTGTRLLALVSSKCQDHDIENHVTQERDVVTDIVDAEGNYVMLKSRADNTAVVHFNICGYEEYAEGQPIDEQFILKLVGCLTSETPAS